MNDNPLPSLAELLARFDGVDVLAAVGALQLMPENADRSVRLQVLALIAGGDARAPSKIAPSAE